MYQILRNNQVTATRSAPLFVRDQPNGVAVPCSFEEADGVVLEGVICALRGKDPRGREIVDVMEVVGRREGTDPAVERNAARLDYLAMMTGVELPEGGA